MIATFVQFLLPSPVSLAEATRLFEANAPGYQNLPGLMRKYYVRAEDGSSVGGIYLWKSRPAAEAIYNDEWFAYAQKAFGVKPVITWFDTPVVVDNLAGTISKAA
jgi:hypothetical protein